MIRINDYAEISFIRFVEKSERTNSNFNTEKIIEDYLLYNCKSWDLKFFLKLFQDFLLRTDQENKPLIELFEDFCTNSDSLQFISPESINKRPYLNPYLLQFWYLMKNEVDYKVINDYFIHMATESYHRNLGLDNWFNAVTKRYSTILSFYFNKFMSNTYYHHYYYDFNNWRSHKREQLSTPPYNGDSTNFFSFDERRIRLRHLVYTPRDEISENLISRDIIKPDDDFQYINFLHYLVGHNININKHLTYPALMRYVEMYCNETGQKKAPLTKFAKSINKKDNLFSKILSLWNRNKKGTDFDFDRVNLPKAHSLILFPKHNKLSEFLNLYWEDIHHMTHDIMDIYYTEEDFKTNVSGYKRLNQLQPSFQRADVTLPAIFVWEKFGTEVEFILLDKLSHKEIYDVLEYFKLSIQNNTNFIESVKLTKEQVKEIIKKRESEKTNGVHITNSNIMTVGHNNHLENPNIKVDN
ncbi:hypothetical protein AJ85_06430 [Alkalihalobacillus alcalophilus ATCC 27647 = CGMCC 1.3604]|uniref:Uncharacterized protein n=1 Tax=Alkalihalobacillus alcalophilus ATCC 27647 = CGMCC 1.3604 TaxID=1218173 RepID=A0A094XIR5_ALKAL|nr:hypothetical protein [Alkalihalobacillus alcalophilus]KGA98650.1 hypothetical protein BALCAV_0203250 [Alkalihalobacillus alcalophilus ATCC 27647 = CGMCC 1.3604]MED1562427.1 hypothetical protein [Alkalihalobacillus alcalophilus]THG91163.1 hypothetical protein AJ85_06430 [Alkalihalobacillus alcalophilus ATCC 27647 = CGMCC 1.3604]